MRSAPPPTFVLAGDAAYHFLVATNAARIRALYPDSLVLLYDYGFTPEQRSGLRAAGFAVVDWRDRVADVKPLRRSLSPEQRRKLTFAFNARRTGLRKRLRKFVLKRFPGSRAARRIEDAALRFETLLAEKIRCMRDASARCGDAPLVFLDADAILFETVDEVLDHGADVSVTLIEGEKSFAFNRCFVLNSGVLFFGPRVAARTAFLDAWWAEALGNPEWLREQTALVRLIERQAPEAFEPWRETTLTLDGVAVGLRVLPCRVYNFFEMENADPATFPDAKVYHFAGRSQQPEAFRRLLCYLDERRARRPAPARTPADSVRPD